MLEDQVESPVVARAEAAGYFVRKVKWLGRDGAPDRLFARADRGSVFVEFKRPGEDARRRQRNEHRDMRAAGIEVHVVDNIEEALRILWLA